MNDTVIQDCADCLRLTGGDKTAAPILTLAAALRECQFEPRWAAD